VADSANSGYFTGGSGFLITPPSELTTLIITGAPAPFTMTNDTRYIIQTSANVTLNLPTSSTIGQTNIIDNNSTFRVTIGQSAGQSIRVGVGGTTTPGVGGMITSVTQGDSIYIVNILANTNWYCEDTFGATLDIT
jgi:hypothetical protein